MYCVKEKGGDRQILHEAIRKHSVAAAQVVKSEGKDNDLLERILSDSVFDLTKEELDKLVDVRQFVGLAPVQTEEYVKVIKTVLSNYDIENEGFGKVNV